ncbi:hypothetical protein BDEG_20210 [Batrachochytrium dendrobatidis JEL423]|uniref:Adhesin domain-containing protein n=1 Tax=Batrachochytrium dendrobatidis (strain JEL423) TaxID=403673 RepID=A0A177W8P6_BATDL|nr:hypothetical protein BDEG_20210 [Batrachochytrium dendrobatidis JEL423]
MFYHYIEYQVSELTINTVDSDSTNLDSIKFSYKLNSSNEFLQDDLVVDAQVISDHLELVVTPPASVPSTDKLKLFATITLPTSLATVLTTKPPPTLCATVSQGVVTIQTPTDITKATPFFSNVGIKSDIGNIHISGVAVNTTKLDTGLGNIQASLLASDSFIASTGAGDVQLRVGSFNSGGSASYGIPSGLTVVSEAGVGSISGSVTGYKSFKSDTGAGNVELDVSPGFASKTICRTAVGNVHAQVLANDGTSEYMGYFGKYKVSTSIGDIKVTGHTADQCKNKSNFGIGGTISGRIGKEDANPSSSLTVQSSAGNVALTFLM